VPNWIICRWLSPPSDKRQAGEEEEHRAALLGDFIYEPEPEQILERLLPVYVETELYRALLESARTGRIVKLVRSADQSCQLMGGTLGNAIRTICGRMRFGHERLIRAFYDNLRRGQPPPVDGAQGRLVVGLLEEITATLAAAAPGRG